MTHGWPFLLKLRSPKGDFQTFAGFRAAALTARPRSMSIEAVGIFLTEKWASYCMMLLNAGAQAPLQLSFESGDKFTGDFIVTNLIPGGEMQGEPQYRITLETTGPVATI